MPYFTRMRMHPYGTDGGRMSGCRQQNNSPAERGRACGKRQPARQGDRPRQGTERRKSHRVGCPAKTGRGHWWRRQKRSCPLGRSSAQAASSRMPLRCTSRLQTCSRLPNAVSATAAAQIPRRLALCQTFCSSLTSVEQHLCYDACAGNDAGMCFEKAAGCHLKCDSPHEAATAYTEAANCYKKTDAKSTRAAQPHIVWRSAVSHSLTFLGM